MKLAIICGGPSKERGISLNSARSIMDHLPNYDLTILYVGYLKQFYLLDSTELYSNTPSDFDFKLDKPLTEEELVCILKKNDIVFPVIHGKFGEDGELQEFLEKHMIPFVGSSSKACKKMFHKNYAGQFLKKNNFQTCPFFLIDENTTIDSLVEFFNSHKKGVVKPCAGGSSIGVSLVISPQEALERAYALDEFPVLLEPFLTGKEFTVVLIEGRAGPVALIPSEISIDSGEIFDYRRKYLPTSNTKWLCPASFSDNIIAKIQKRAEQLFVLFGAKDFARFDGWVFEGDEILFSDFNPISGMEQNSFLFQQASKIGLSHHQILHYIITKNFPCEEQNKPISLPVLFGGTTAERQVSVMSGTNVWLKLKKFYNTIPCFLDKNNYVWELPYSYALSHTTEEIYENCLGAQDITKRLEKLVPQIRTRLDLPLKEISAPSCKTFDDFLKDHNSVFIALHGGIGEDGTIQKRFEDKDIKYNGSDLKTSALCMNKFATSQKINALKDSFLIAAPQISLSKSDLKKGLDFNECIQSLNCTSLLIKPQNDGCSTGVFRIRSQDDLNFYSSHLDQAFMNTTESRIEFGDSDFFIIEPFVQTDFIYVQMNDLIYEKKTGWVELTVGVLECDGIYEIMPASITVSSGSVLTMEEKFQGGTGINITPPPFINEAGIEQLEKSIEKAAQTLGIKGYARLDVFFNIDTYITHLIEANTLPALTPSTVIYHQALKIGLRPSEFLKRICPA